MVEVLWGRAPKHEDVGCTPNASGIGGVDGELQLPEHHLKSTGRQGD